MIRGARKRKQMAKLILPIESLRGTHGAPAPMETAPAPLQAAALYCLDPELCGNVNFVLFLSGNSTFRVDVSFVYDD
jgi:hypothetical protein